MGLGRSRWCSWIVEIAGVGARRPSPDSESSRKGHDVEARRSDPAKLSSFDEAAVEKGRVLPQKEHDRGRQRQARDRPDGRIRQREGALLGGLSIKSPQVRAGRVPRETRGHRAPVQSWRHAVKRASTRGHVIRLRFGLAGGRGSHPRTRKRTGTVIRESSGSPGARIVSSVAEIGTKYLPCQEQSAPKGAWSFDGVA
jgi:hypothetical protein